MLWKILGVLLVIWLVFTFLGFVVKGLFWLAIIGGLLFVGTVVYGTIKGKDGTKRIGS